MKSAWTYLLTFSAALLFFGGCASTVLVKIPPVIDLSRFGTIGIIEFSSTSQEEKKLGSLAAQKFLQTVQEAQPGIPVLELGPEKQVLEAVNKNKFDIEAAKSIGAKYGVNAIFVGDLVVSPVRPKLNLSMDLSSIGARAEVNASLRVRMLEAGSGATAWTASRSGSWTLASASAGNFGLSLGVSDSEKKYLQMIHDLTDAVTRDLQPSYERRRVEK